MPLVIARTLEVGKITVRQLSLAQANGRSIYWHMSDFRGFLRSGAGLQPVVATRMGLMSAGVSSHIGHSPDSGGERRASSGAFASGRYRPWIRGLT